MINKLITREDSRTLSTLLTEAYFSAGPELKMDGKFRQKLIKRIAVAPIDDNLKRFPSKEVAPIAKVSIGKIKSKNLSEASFWIFGNKNQFDEKYFFKSFQGWRKMNPFQLSEFIWLFHSFASNETLIKIASFPDIYSAPGPNFSTTFNYVSQADVALIGLGHRQKFLDSIGFEISFLNILRTLCKPKIIFGLIRLDFIFADFVEKFNPKKLPQTQENWFEFSSLSRSLTKRIIKIDKGRYSKSLIVKKLNKWSTAIEKAIAKKEKQKIKSPSKFKARKTNKATTKKKKAKGKSKKKTKGGKSS
jgi:hypothetical protein